MTISPRGSSQKHSAIPARNSGTEISTTAAAHLRSLR